MSRVTIKNLEFLVERINKLTNSPLTAYTKVDNKLIANVGHFYLDQAYGGIKLVRMYNEGGGIEEITRNGYGTRKELYYQLEAMIIGLEMQVKS